MKFLSLYRLCSLFCLVVNFGFSLALALGCVFPARAFAANPAPTTTSLAIAPGASAAWGSVVTLKASVVSGGSPVSPGLVLFCDASAPYCTDVHVLGQAQLRTSGIAGLNGTASLNVVLPIGVHQIKAVFQGTKVAAASESPSQTFTVTAANPYPTASAIAASGTPGNYSLTGTVTALGSSLSGTVDFFDQTAANTSIAEALLGPQAFVFIPSPQQATLGSPSAVGDFNGDGRLDQATLSNKRLSIFLGNGDGTFTLKFAITLGSAPYTVTVGDFNADDHLDIAVGDDVNSTVTVLLGNGDGTFTVETPIPTIQHVELVAAGDFDGDGNADIVANGAFGNLQLLLGKGDGTFTPMPMTVQGESYPTQSATGDFNSDGRMDLVLSGFDNIFLLLSNGDGAFTQKRISTVCDDACPGVGAADFNGDGKLDLAVADRGELDNFGGAIFILLGDGTGAFTPGVTLGGQYFDEISIGDFNGDGIADIAYGVNGPGAAVFLGAANGTFPTLIGASSTVYSFLTGDVNNDGRTDMIFGNPTNALSEVQASATADDIAIGPPNGFHQVFAQYEGDTTSGRSLSATVPLAGPGATTIVPAPMLSPSGGSYATAQAVTITDATPGAKFYYTTDGTTPTQASTLYIGPILVTASSSETISAIAVVENYWPSPPTSATYTSPNGFAFNGFSCCGQIQTNGAASYYSVDDGYASNALVLTQSLNSSNSAGSAFYPTPVNVQSFTTAFSFQLTSAVADGFTFTIQNAGVGAGALGSYGGSLGYRHIGQSAAIKFDLFNNDGEGPDSTGLYTDGASPTIPSIDLTRTGIDLHSGHMMGAYITYDGTTLNLTIADLVTQAHWSHPFSINIPAVVGGNTAYVGFTGGTGASSATQQIYTWTYQSGPPLYYGIGFSSTSALSMNGSASLAGATLQLTSGAKNEAGSAYYPLPVNIQDFGADFDFHLSDAAADGFTFVIQNSAPTALGSQGGGLGYAHIPHSVAVKFDLYGDAGEGANSTGIYIDGAAPNVPAIDLTGTGINLHSGDTMHASIAYDGTNLTLTITDLVTLATWSHAFPVAIPAVVGGNTAYVGFTAGTGSLTAVQQILDWTFQ